MPAWRLKTADAERDYKISACNRERIRMRDMNIAYETLRKILPKGSSQGKKMSKIESLRMAIDYIKQLQEKLEEPRDSPDVPSEYSGGVEPYYIQNANENFSDQGM